MFPTPLHAAAARAVGELAGVDAEQLKVEVAPRAELGDLAIGCFAIAKQKGGNPAQHAQQIAAAFTANEWFASATAAGPFVNFRAARPAVLRWLVEATARGELLPAPGAGQTIVIDYSSPNVSKHLAYHHIRSTMIGHALVQIFRALGYTVVGLNHLGDWGTTHGNLLEAWRLWGPKDAGATVDVALLNELYVKFSAAAKDDPAIKEAGRAAFKRLEDGDPALRALWEKFRAVSLAEYQAVYDLLGVSFDVVKGESEYVPDVPRVLAELAAKGLSSASEGALVVQLAGDKTPLMLVKDDGATTYATRDIPSAVFRWDTWHFTRSLYVVDRGQSLHFKQLFATLRLMGYEWAARCEHIPFGLVQIGGKKGSSRAGNVVLLKDVVAQAEDGVRALIGQLGALDDATRDVIAHEVGAGAVVFANLVAQRDKDVDFDWDRVIALQGDSGPYVQYNHARCASIVRKAGAPAGDVDFSKLSTEAEWAVARKLLDFPAAVIAATPKCEPHIVCHYLLELAGEFSRWYTAGNTDPALRVLTDDLPVRAARLALVGAVQATLARGLQLLGMAAPQQM